MGDGLLVQLNTLAFPTLMRGFFGPIVKFLYFLIEKSIDLMYELAGNRFGLDKEIDTLTGNFFAIFVIFMVFKLTIAMLNYLINPDSFTDKNAGFSKLISRVIISIILLVSINPFFNFLFNFQTAIIGNNSTTNPTGNVIDNLILSNQEILTLNIDGETIDIYTTRMSDQCPEGYKVFSTTKGGIFAISALKPFYQPTDKGEVDDVTEWEDFFTEGKMGYCGFDFDNLQDSYYDVFHGSFDRGVFSAAVEIGKRTMWTILTEGIYDALNPTQDGPNIDDNVSILGLLNFPHTGSEFVTHRIYNAKSGDWDVRYEEDFIIEFRYFWAIVFGIAILFMIITFCFDIVVRALTLFLYQLIAPIPIISYMSPNKKDTEMLSNWGRRTFGCWASLFIRIAILDFVVYFSQIAINLFDNDDTGLVQQIFVLVGTLMFAKKLPKLLEEIIPGLKMGEPLELNPFKRISRDALGGKALLGAGAGIAAGTLSAGTNFATRAFGSTIDANGNRVRFGNWRNKEGKFTARSFGGGLAKTAGSTVAGGARGMTNAFNRTRKDGNILAGAWNGYQTAMYSKLIREDTYRKAGLENASIGERAKFALGSAKADLDRYAGVLNEGQLEYLRADELDREIQKSQTQLDQEKLAWNNHKRTSLEPYQRYAEYGKKIKERIENDSKVKEAQRNLEDAQASGDPTAIQNARAQLDLREKLAGNRLLNSDDEVKYYASKMKEIQDEMATQGVKLKDVRNKDGSFNKASIFDTLQSANVLADEYGLRDKEFERRQEEINALKQTDEYIRTHNENSTAKLQNAGRMNPEPQRAGFKPSGTGSIQSRFYDTPLYSGMPPLPGTQSNNSGHGGHGGHGGPGGQGGPGPGHGGQGGP